jgi:hypothetical protein
MCPGTEPSGSFLSLFSGGEHALTAISDLYSKDGGFQSESFSGYIIAEFGPGFGPGVGPGFGPGVGPGVGPEPDEDKLFFSIRIITIIDIIIIIPVTIYFFFESFYYINYKNTKC